MALCEVCGVSVIAVIISAVVYMILGMLWYGPMFGKSWVKLTGKKDMKENMDPKTIAMGIVVAILQVFVLAKIMEMSGVMSVDGGAMLGALVAIGFSLPINLNRVLWEKIPIQLFWINTLHAIASLMLAGAIIGAF
jgi:hypothetical protein